MSHVSAARRVWTTCSRVCQIIALVLWLGADSTQAQDLSQPPVVEPEAASAATPSSASVLNARVYQNLFGGHDVEPLLALNQAPPMRQRRLMWNQAPWRVGSEAIDSVLQATQQSTPAHPEPTHTGLKAVLFETGSDFKAFPRRRSTWVILGIAGAAAAAAHPADDYVNEHLVGSDAVGKFFAPGKYIGAVYVQSGVAVGLYVVGRYVLPRAADAPKTNKVSHLGFDMLRAIIVSQALTQGIKVTVRRDRPTGECCAFPSGHASVTFATASVLERHLGYRGAWPTFLIASYVAASRLHDNRHFLSDVVFGAGLGIASGWTVVGRHGRSNYALMPTPIRGGMMVTLTRQDRQRTHR